MKLSSTHIVKWLLITNKNTFDINKDDSDAIQISEQCYCKFIVDVHGDKIPKMSLGDYELKLKLVDSNSDGMVKVYETDSVQCFKNFIGLAQAELFFGTTGKFTSSPINIYARKATYDRALSFLKMINEKSDISSICFSVTKLNSDSSKGSKNLSAMLTAGIKALEYFQLQRPRFAQFPCSKSRSKSRVVKYSSSTHLDERSIAYLCSHPDTLVPSLSSEGDVRIGCRNMIINDIETNTLVRDTNVFENQVILSFLYKFLSYLKSVKIRLEQSNISQASSISLDGEQYLSIDRLLYDSGLILNIHKEKIEHAIEHCSQCIRFIQDRLPCEIYKGKNMSPVPTQQVLARTHYLQLFSLIKNFYDIGEPQWRGQLEFYGLRNLYKIYEFVCLIYIIDSMHTLGFLADEASFVDRNRKKVESRPINEPCNYYVFYKDNIKMELFYEPFAIQAAKLHTNVATGTIVDLVHKNKTTWNPDFVIIISDGENTNTHILDAKYSDLKTVQSYHIDECAFKYTTKMMALANDNTLKPIDSMTLLFSGDHYRYESFYNDEFSLYDQNGMFNQNRVTPAIGMLSHNENDIDSLTKFLGHIFHI